jgi:formamidopyrimidine-DNA glycosylase
MPELPDITVYIEALERYIGGRQLERVRIGNPFLLRSIAPPLEAVEGAKVASFRRLGKRIAIGMDNGVWMVIHLMIAGRLHWSNVARAAIKKKLGLAAFDFAHGTLQFTEAGSTRRASLHLVQGEDALAAFDRGGLEVLDSSLDAFRDALTSENHTVKRALTDPTLFSGIGNAYSDEILHRAKLSPMKLTSKMSDEEIARLHEATRETMLDWIERLRKETGEGFPEKVTAFRPDMAVHGRFNLPCPVCSAPIQRIVYAANECNYCARCQNEGRRLADRAMSRLLKEDWPREMDSIE